jgi:hypothetical protein
MTPAEADLQWADYEDIDWDPVLLGKVCECACVCVCVCACVNVYDGVVVSIQLPLAN